jgi:hypothetical protein
LSPFMSLMQQIQYIGRLLSHTGMGLPKTQELHCVRDGRVRAAAS